MKLTFPAFVGRIAFSALAALKANIGGYADAIPLEDALQTCAINAAGVVGLGALAISEANAGQANLERIVKGGLLVRLEVEPASSSRPLSRATARASSATCARCSATCRCCCSC